MPDVPVFTSFLVTPSTALAEVGSVLTLRATARYVDGSEAPITTLRWRIDSGAAGGTITATTGKLTLRQTPGTTVIRATHANGMYALATVFAATASGGGTDPDPDPEPEPEPDPEPTPDTPAVRVGLFAYSLPTEEIGPLWTGKMQAMTPRIVEHCAEVAARGGIVIGSQGTYDRFFKNGRYDRDTMTRWIESFLPLADQLKRAHDAKRFFGVQMADDFASTPRWPPDGLDVAELTRIARVWRRCFPWMRLGLRARPRQFTGQVPQELDFVICQFRYWGLGNESPERFRDAELALADARGWDVLWSMNFQHGGGMVNGVKRPMTAAQIKATGLAFAAAKQRNLGVGGWKFEPWVTEPVRAIKAAVG